MNLIRNLLSIQILICVYLCSFSQGDSKGVAIADTSDICITCKYYLAEESILVPVYENDPDEFWALKVDLLNADKLSCFFYTSHGTQESYTAHKIGEHEYVYTFTTKDINTYTLDRTGQYNIQYYTIIIEYNPLSNKIIERYMHLEDTIVTTYQRHYSGDISGYYLFTIESVEDFNELVEIMPVKDKMYLIYNIRLDKMEAMRIIYSGDALMIGYRNVKSGKDYYYPLYAQEEQLLFYKEISEVELKHMYRRIR